jgi:hypothetical protein
MTKKRKFEIIKVDVINWSMDGDKYIKDYWGKVVSDDSGQVYYCDSDGRMLTCIPKELANIIKGSTVEVNELVSSGEIKDMIENRRSSEATPVSLIDKIGAKPKTILQVEGCIIAKDPGRVFSIEDICELLESGGFCYAGHSEVHTE